jgi:choline dehydrogenase-like flavoprotein
MTASHGEGRPDPAGEQPLEVVVVGGGQAGLAMAWHLTRQGRRFVVLEAGPEVGQVWRSRWDSLKLFTPAQYDALPGMAFPAPADTYPAKHAVADYLRAYAAAFDLPVRLNATVTEFRRLEDGSFEVRTADQTYRARQVVVATGPFQVRFVLGLMHVTVTSRVGRRMRRRDIVIGTSRKRLERAGVRLRPRLVDAEGRTVRFADHRLLEDVGVVVWATGYRPDYGWIHVPGVVREGQVVHRRGVTEVPGLYFLGLSWQHTRGSALLGFVNDDAAYLADQIATGPAAAGVTQRPAGS